MISKSRVINDNIKIPLILGEFKMIEFCLNTLSGLPDKFMNIAMDMLMNLDIPDKVGFFTIHGKILKKQQTLRRPGPHIDGNYEPYYMSFGGGEGGWKVGENGPAVGTNLHKRQYESPFGGIILCSNYSSCLGWNGEYDGLPKTGGNCSHMELDDPFFLKENTVYYGNNHFIHESLPVKEDVHRVFARITLAEGHKYQEN
jgi:hypothetical protein